VALSVLPYSGRFICGPARGHWDDVACGCSSSGFSARACEGEPAPWVRRIADNDAPHQSPGRAETRCLATFVSLPALIVGYLLVLRIHRAVDTLIKRINKTKVH